MGGEIPELMGSCVFTDFYRASDSDTPTRGVLAYTWAMPDCKLHDYNIIDVNYDFGSASAYYTCLGTNIDQTKLYIGVYSSQNVADLNQGTIFEIARG